MGADEERIEPERKGYHRHCLEAARREGDKRLDEGNLDERSRRCGENDRRRERGQESARGGEDEAAQQMPVEADEARADPAADQRLRRDLDLRLGRPGASPDPCARTETPIAA
jgi:hypothetical protein